MKRRWLVLVELVSLAALCTWVGLMMYDHTPRPADAISLKVQLAHADDHVYLTRQQDGQYRYQVRHDDGRTLLLAPEEFASFLYDDQHSRGWLEAMLNISSPAGFIWVALGLGGQVLFTGRMIVQWLVSTKARRSVVPPIFWWMSLAGSTMLLIYFVWRRDPIGILGQAIGWTIYIHNLWLIYTKPGEKADVTQDPAPEPGIE